jgi:hypothetical protein
MSTVTRANTAEQMMQLFPASTRAHATYDPNPATHKRRDRDGKLEVRYWTKREPVTIDLWERHLAGEYPLVLGLVCDDGTSGVSVLDVDQYDLDVIALVRAIKNCKLPLYVRRSKSGGAHVYAFHEHPIPAAEASRVAEAIARCVGLTKVEFFPKPQTPDSAQLPKALNMPYLGGDGGFIRPGSKVGGEILVEEFLSKVVRLSSEQCADLMQLAIAKRGKGVSIDPEDNHAPISAEQLELKLRVALSVVPSDDYDVWYRIGAAIFDGLGYAGYALFDEWSRQSGKYDARACDHKWRECQKIKSIKVNTIFWHADQHDRSWRTLYRRLLSRGVAA